MERCLLDRSGGAGVDEPAQEVPDLGRLAEGEGRAGLLGELGHEDPCALPPAAQHLPDTTVETKPSETEEYFSAPEFQAPEIRSPRRSGGGGRPCVPTLNASSSVRSSPM